VKDRLSLLGVIDDLLKKEQPNFRGLLTHQKLLCLSKISRGIKPQTRITRWHELSKPRPLALGKTTRISLPLANRNFQRKIIKKMGQQMFESNGLQNGIGLRNFPATNEL
jgi:hypothetical protein